MQTTYHNQPALLQALLRKASGCLHGDEMSTSSFQSDMSAIHDKWK